MLRFSLSAILIFFIMEEVLAQSAVDSTNAARQMQFAEEALKREKTDSLNYYLQKARKAYLAEKNWDRYSTDFIKIVQPLFSKYTNDVKYVETGIQHLKTLRKDIQTEFGVNNSRETEVCYQIARGYYYMALGFNNIYDVNAASSSFDSCHAYAKSNLAQLEKLPTKETALDRANHYNILGVAFNARGNASQALIEYEKVRLLRIAELAKEDDRIASIYYNIGNAYSNLKLYNKALDAYINSIKIRELTFDNNRSRLANAYFNVGVLYDEKGEYDNAIIFYNKVKGIYDTYPKDFVNVEELIAEVSTHLAVCYQNKGAYQESGVYHQQSIQKYGQSGGENAVKIADYHSNQAILAGLKGEYEKQVQLQEEALRLYQQKLKPNDPRLMQALNNLGNAYAENGQYDRAMKELQGARQLIEKDSTQLEQFASLISDIGLIHFKQGNQAEAKKYNLQALKILLQIFNKKSYKIAVVYNNLAKIADAENDHEGALNYLQRALAANHLRFEKENPAIAPSPEGYFRYDYFVESLMLKARIMQHGPKPNSLLAARSLYQVIDTVLTQVQNELIASEDKIRLSEKIYDLSEAAIANCIKLAETTGDRHYWEEAFRYVERSKNTVLAQSITANHAKQFAGIPDSLIALEDKLQSNIRYYKLKLLDSPANIDFQNELFDAQLNYRTLVQMLEKEYPLYYQLKYDRTVPSVYNLQQTLPENTALLSYFTGDTALYTFVITHKDFQVYHSPIEKDFYNQQIWLRKAILYQLNEDYVELAYQLYQQLFNFKLDNDIQTLIIIPDGNLSKLPFETLLTSKINPRSSNNFSQLPYLLNDYQISYVLSGTLYFQKQFHFSPSTEVNEGLLAYAPVFDEPQDIGFFSNGARNPLTTANTGGVGRTLTTDGQYVSSLPATADEVQAIAEVFKQKGQQASTFLFQSANENQLKHSDMTRSKYLHIATHGFINEEQPDLSGLLLFPDSTELEDHILYSGEVYGLNLKASLVVLSACETGLGTVANGEGLLGLSRAFFYAGAENLIVSLWKVQDRATALLMVDFYRHHLNHTNPTFAAPLRQAKLDMIQSNDFSHPYYWSAFVLIGQ